MATRNYAWLPSDMASVLSDENSAACRVLYMRPRPGIPISDQAVSFWGRAANAFGAHKKNTNGGLGSFTLAEFEEATATPKSGIRSFSIAPAFRELNNRGTCGGVGSSGYALSSATAIQQQRRQTEEAANAARLAEEQGRLAKAAGWAWWAATALPVAVASKVATTLAAAASYGNGDHGDGNGGVLGLLWGVDELFVLASELNAASNKVSTHASTLDGVDRVVGLDHRVHRGGGGGSGGVRRRSQGGENNQDDDEGAADDDDDDDDAADDAACAVSFSDVCRAAGVGAVGSAAETSSSGSFARRRQRSRAVALCVEELCLLEDSLVATGLAVVSPSSLAATSGGGAGDREGEARRAVGAGGGGAADRGGPVMRLLSSAEVNSNIGTTASTTAVTNYIASNGSRAALLGAAAAAAAEDEVAIPHPVHQGVTSVDRDVLALRRSVQSVHRSVRLAERALFGDDRGGGGADQPVSATTTNAVGVGVGVGVGGVGGTRSSIGGGERGRLRAEALGRKKQGDQAGALRLLDKVRRLERGLAVKRAALDSMERALAAIHDAHSSADVVAVLVTAKNALQRTRAEVNSPTSLLTAEAVEELMDDLADEVNEVNAVGQALSTPLGGSNLEGVGDDADLDVELEELMRGLDVAAGAGGGGSSSERQVPTPMTATMSALNAAAMTATTSTADSRAQQAVTTQRSSSLAAARALDAALPTAPTRAPTKAPTRAPTRPAEFAAGQAAGAAAHIAQQQQQQQLRGAVVRASTGGVDDGEDERDGSRVLEAA